jgi:hypothetical protein
MINLSFKKFLKVLSGFIGIAYLLTIIFSIISNFQSATSYELGSQVGYNIGFVTPYLMAITIIFTGLFLLNFGIKKFRFSNK